MATPETRTDQIAAVSLTTTEERKPARRFITAAWWVNRYRELSWAWRFNLAILALAALNSVAILIANAFGLGLVVTICSVFYSAAILAWLIGSIILIALSVREFFAAPGAQPPPDTGNHPEQGKA